MKIGGLLRTKQRQPTTRGSLYNYSDSENEKNSTSAFVVSYSASFKANRSFSPAALPVRGVSDLSGDISVGHLDTQSRVSSLMESRKIAACLGYNLRYDSLKR